MHITLWPCISQTLPLKVFEKWNWKQYCVCCLQQWFVVKENENKSVIQHVSHALFCWGWFFFFQYCRIIPPRCRALDLPLLNCVKFQSARFYNLSRCLWMAAWCSGVPATPPSLVLWANWLRLCSVQSPRLLIKMFNRVEPNIEPWGTPLVTGLQLDFMPLITTLSSTVQPVFTPPHCLLI